MIPSAWQKALGFFVDNKLIVFLLTTMLVGAGLYVSPFDWDLGGMPRDRVPVDAIPDIGENQQIVFTEWPGRSPRDIEDQVTYPLTTALLGIPGVRTIRSSSVLGFSSIYVIFEDGTDFYWSRSRVLEKLASLPQNTLPDSVTPRLGPDATALGQVFWYTLEGHDPEGEVAGGWALHELRSIQDWTVRYALQAVPGVSEVASVGGYVQEYQVDVDPEALRAHGVTIEQVAHAVGQSNLDIGARTIEINRVEYLVRGLGFVERVQDLEQAVVTTREHTPIRVSDVARVVLGPAQRRGALDDAGAEAVGGVVVVRYGANPMEVIQRVKEKIREIAPGLPSRTLEDGTESKVTIVPFYDRTTLIDETLGTLSTALVQQILITIIVVLLMLRNLRSSFIISSILPLGVLGAFVAMKGFGVDANIMALGGIAIAIGTMVDMGIVFIENITARLDAREPSQTRAEVVKHAAAEVAPAVATSALTTVVSFLPVFALSASEGKLFAPLAYTKTFALLGALVLSMVLLPSLAHILLGRGKKREELDRLRRNVLDGMLVLVIAVVTVLLARDWMPLGYDQSFLVNLFFVAALIALLMGAFFLFRRLYPTMLAWALRHKKLFMLLPIGVVLLGLLAWRGFDYWLGWLPQPVRAWSPVSRVAHTFPGFGREFMPPFDEGSYLYMPTTMPHASIGEALDKMKLMDAAIAQIPEVERVVGKLGRADSALDPAPVSMYETIITYVPEYGVNEEGEPVRQWRDHIRTPHDIWQEIVAAAEAPGLTSAPVLQPISTRIVMLQSGMRAPMGIKVRGPDLETIDHFGQRLEALLKQVPAIRPETVFADRVVGKPYLEIDIDREAIGRYGLTVERVQRVLSIALGGMTQTRTVEGRERYPVRVRYMREERDSVEAMKRVLVSTPGGEQVPLEELATFRYVHGPQMIKSEDTFLTSYVLFDRQRDVAEVEAVHAARDFLAEKIASGELEVPPGVSYAFAGSYENQVRSEKRLMILVPLALGVIFILLYLQFRRVVTSFIIWSGVAVAVSGGFLLIWLYGQPWFLSFTILGEPMRDLFQVGTVNLSVAVWIGFIALLGIATDDGVVMATYMKQRYEEAPPGSIEEVRQHALAAAERRVRACLMTTATTMLALLPVVMSHGRGSDVMVPMALPQVGGMAIELLTLFVVPVLYCAVEERMYERRRRKEGTV